MQQVRPRQHRFHGSPAHHCAVAAHRCPRIPERAPLLLRGLLHRRHGARQVGLGPRAPPVSCALVERRDHEAARSGSPGPQPVHRLEVVGDVLAAVALREHRQTKLVAAQHHDDEIGIAVGDLVVQVRASLLGERARADPDHAQRVPDHPRPAGLQHHAVERDRPGLPRPSGRAREPLGVVHGLPAIPGGLRDRAPAPRASPGHARPPIAPLGADLVPELEVLHHEPAPIRVLWTRDGEVPFRRHRGGDAAVPVAPTPAAQQQADGLELAVRGDHDVLPYAPPRVHPGREVAGTRVPEPGLQPGPHRRRDAVCRDRRVSPLARARSALALLGQRELAVEGVHAPVIGIDERSGHAGWMGRERGVHRPGGRDGERGIDRGRRGQLAVLGLHDAGCRRREQLGEHRDRVARLPWPQLRQGGMRVGEGQRDRAGPERAEQPGDPGGVRKHGLS